MGPSKPSKQCPVNQITNNNLYHIIAKRSSKKEHLSIKKGSSNNLLFNRKWLPNHHHHHPFKFRKCWSYLDLHNGPFTHLIEHFPLWIHTSKQMCLNKSSLRYHSSIKAFCFAFGDFTKIYIDNRHYTNDSKQATRRENTILQSPNTIQYQCIV